MFKIPSTRVLKRFTVGQIEEFRLPKKFRAEEFKEIFKSAEQWSRSRTGVS